MREKVREWGEKKEWIKMYKVLDIKIVRGM